MNLTVVMHTWHEKKVWLLVGFVVSVFLCVCFVGFGFVCSFLVWSEGLFLFFKSFHIKRRAWCEIQTWSKIGLLCLRGLEGSIFIYLEYISVSGVEKLFFLSGSTLVNSGIRGSRVNKYHWHHSDSLEFLNFSSHQCYQNLHLCALQQKTSL